MRNDQVTQVRGYADQMLRDKNNPTDPSNRRISILVKNDNEKVPELSAEGVVNGSTPLPASAKTPAPAENGAKPQGAQPATPSAPPTLLRPPQLPLRPLPLLRPRRLQQASSRSAGQACGKRSAVSPG